MASLVKYSLRWAFRDSLLAKTAIKKTIEKYANEKMVNTVAKRIRANLLYGQPGTRCWPPVGGMEETKLGFRIDVGDLVIRNETTGEAVRLFNVQFNKNAENSTIRKIAQSHSHEKRIIIEIGVNVTTGQVGLTDEEIAGVVKYELLESMQTIGM